MKDIDTKKKKRLVQRIKESDTKNKNILIQSIKEIDTKIDTKDKID